MASESGRPALPADVDLRRGSHLSEAVIEDARRRQRRRRLLILGVLALAVVVYLAAKHDWRSGTTRPSAVQLTRHLTPKQATACLTAHHALATPTSTAKDLLDAPAIQVSFALVPGQRQDALTIYFERDPATAKDVVAKLLRRLNKFPIARTYFTIKDNAVAFWNSPTRTRASQRTVSGCL